MAELLQMPFLGKKIRTTKKQKQNQNIIGIMKV